MNVIEKTDELVTISFSREEFAKLYGIMIEVTQQWKKLDEAALGISKHEAEELEENLHRVAKASTMPVKHDTRSAA